MYHGLAHLFFPAGGQGLGVGGHLAEVGFHMQGHDVSLQVALHFFAEGFDGDLPGFQGGIRRQLQIHCDDELADSMLSTRR